MKIQRTSTAVLFVVLGAIACSGPPRLTRGAGGANPTGTGTSGTSSSSMDGALGTGTTGTGSGTSGTIVSPAGSGATPRN